MKCFRTDTTAMAGIDAVEIGGRWAVPIGAEGMGNRRELVPLHPAFKTPASMESGRVLLLAATPAMTTAISPVLTDLALEDAARRALVHAVYDFRFRGNGSWTIGPTEDGPWTELPHIQDVPTPRDLKIKGVSILAYGFQSGKHREYLLIVPPRTHIRLSRAGRTYGVPKVLIFSWDGETLLRRTPEEIRLQKAESIPINELRFL